MKLQYKIITEYTCNFHDEEQAIKDSLEQYDDAHADSDFYLKPTPVLVNIKVEEEDKSTQNLENILCGMPSDYIDFYERLTEYIGGNKERADKVIDYLLKGSLTIKNLKKIVIEEGLGWRNEKGCWWLTKEGEWMDDVFAEVIETIIK